jgi:hypothetical protein
MKRSPTRHQPKRRGIAAGGIQVTRAPIARPLANGNRADARARGAGTIRPLNLTWVPTP